MDLVAQVDKLTKVQKDILNALAENRIVPHRAARVLGMHSNNVYYHVGQIRAKTGYDPLDFWSLVTLLQLIENETTAH